MSATLSRFLRGCTGRYDATKGKVATLFEMDAMSAARKADTTVKTGVLNFEMSAARLDVEENRYFHPLRSRKDLRRTHRVRAAEPPEQNFNARRGRTSLLKVKIRLTLLCICASKLRQFCTAYSRLLFARRCRSS